MINKKSTKSALLTSSISLLLCFTMLLGTTFAWFTDTVTSANNIIKSGNLDIEFDYWDGDEWKTVKDASDILTNKLWEPGVTEVAYLRLTNKGSLALKYQLGVNIVSETSGKNVAGDEFKLSDYIYFDVVEGVNGETNAYANREAAMAVATETTKISKGYTKVSDMKANSDPQYLAMVVYMPETVGNEANHNGYDVPEINLGINVVATQLASEEDSFGNEYDENAKYPLVKGQKIKSGIYDENPALYDETLAEPNSEYIAIDFVKDGKQQWVVSKRSETVVVSAGGANTRLVRNYKVRDASGGKLWSIIKELENNEHSTVYLYPGTYNEATTINVCSSMDIVGLGDKDSVKIVKGSSSSSNRHLFNCNGTKSDHIQVTLRNLYLDATAKTTNNKDNAAVQSIRKSKVKCYDLTIVKGTGWDAVAFYVNGNNAVDGVKYPAYLYAENCTLNTTRTFGIVTTAGSYKFYHSNLKYDNGNATYSNNSGSILNQSMDANDWDW